MSGGYEYNLTTQSEFQEMKQKYQNLMEENHSLKQTIEQLIAINNELSDTIEQFNNSDWAKSQRSKSMKKSNQETGAGHEQCQKIVQDLEERVEYFKGLAADKMEGQQNTEIVDALQGLIQSFKQVQKLYEEQINTLCEETDTLKNDWENKIFKLQESYFEKTRVLEEVIKQLRKKEEIVQMIEKKYNEQQRGYRRPQRRNEVEMTNERKWSSPVQNRSVQVVNPKQNIEISNKQIQDLKQKQKKLNQQLKQKDKTIAAYSQLLLKLRKKLTQKF